MRFLVFQHIACEHPGIFRDLMAQDDVSWDSVELDEGESIPAFDGYDALLVMGGPMDVWQTEDNPWLLAEIDAIRAWVESGRPYLGFCLGHQLLAEALGGKVGPANQPEIGILPVQLSKAGARHWLFRDCPQEIYSLQWHSAEVTKLPNDGIVLAHSPACAVNAMAWGNAAASVQFHIELTNTTVREWGEVPEYAQALDQALGEGALNRMDEDASSRMEDFNQLSSVLYRNFSNMVRGD